MPVAEVRRTIMGLPSQAYALRYMGRRDRGSMAALATVAGIKAAMEALYCATSSSPPPCIREITRTNTAPCRSPRPRSYSQQINAPAARFSIHRSKAV